MPTELETLQVMLEVKAKGFEDQLAKTSLGTARQLAAIEARFAGLERAVSKSMAKAQRQISRQWDVAPMTRSVSAMTAALGALGVGLSTREVLHYADAWKGAQNALAVAGVKTSEQADVLGQLYQSAQNNAAPLSSLVTLYGRARQSAKELGANQEDLIRFTDGVATALRVNGTSATEASGALLQLSQLLATGTVHAEEFNSVNEGALPILQAVAGGLEAAGGSVARLRALVIEGKVSSRQFFDAFLKGLPALQQRAASSTQTVEQGFTKIQNALTRYIGQTDSSLGATARLTQGLNWLADNFDRTADMTLKLAAVIAAALVGRSIAGMLASLGTASAALVRFMQTMAAMRTAGGLASALGGVGAAAGPIGAILGVAAAGAVLYFGEQAVATASRTAELTAEMERLGLAAPKAAGDVNQAAQSLDGLSAGEKARKLRTINIELDRMKNRGPLAGTWLDQDEIASFDAILHRLAPLKGAASRARTGQGAAAPDDKAAVTQIEQIAEAMKRGQIEASKALEIIEKIGRSDISKPVIELNEALRKSVQHFSAYQQLQGAHGGTGELDQYKEKAAAIIADMQKLTVRRAGIASAFSRLVSPEQVRQADELIKKLLEGKESADNTRKALAAIADVNLNTKGFIEQLNEIVTAVGNAISQARTGAAVMGGFLGGNDRGSPNDPNLKKFYEDEARQNALTKAQLKRRKTIDEVRKEAGKVNIQLGDKQAGRLADERIAADERRDGEGKKGGKSKSQNDYQREVANIQKETVAFGREKDALSLSAFEAAKAEASFRLLDAAKAAGIPVTDKLRRENEKLAETYARSKTEGKDAAQAQQELIERQKFAGHAISGFLSDIISGGENAQKALSNLIKKLSETVLQAALLGEGPLAGLFGGGKPGKTGVGGIIGEVFSLFKADGGYISGPGSGRSDSIPARLSNGEFVVNAHATRQHRTLLEAINAGRLPGFANGGLVAAPPRIALAGLASIRQAAPAFHMPVTIDARGATADVVPALQREIRDLQNTVRNIHHSYANARGRGML